MQLNKQVIESQEGNSSLFYLRIIFIFTLFQLLTTNKEEVVFFHKNQLFFYQVTNQREQLTYQLIQNNNDTRYTVKQIPSVFNLKIIHKNKQASNQMDQTKQNKINKILLQLKDKAELQIISDCLECLYSKHQYSQAKFYYQNRNSLFIDVMRESNERRIIVLLLNRSKLQQTEDFSDSLMNSFKLGRIYAQEHDYYQFTQRISDDYPSQTFDHSKTQKIVNLLDLNEKQLKLVKKIIYRSDDDDENKVSKEDEKQIANFIQQCTSLYKMTFIIKSTNSSHFIQHIKFNNQAQSLIELNLSLKLKRHLNQKSIISMAQQMQYLENLQVFNLSLEYQIISQQLAKQLNSSIKKLKYIRRFHLSSQYNEFQDSIKYLFDFNFTFNNLDRLFLSLYDTINSHSFQVLMKFIERQRNLEQLILYCDGESLSANDLKYGLYSIQKLHLSYLDLRISQGQEIYIKLYINSKVSNDNYELYIKLNQINIVLDIIDPNFLQRVKYIKIDISYNEGIESFLNSLQNILKKTTQLERLNIAGGMFSIFNPKNEQFGIQLLSIISKCDKLQSLQLILPSIQYPNLILKYLSKLKKLDSLKLRFYCKNGFVNIEGLINIEKLIIKFLSIQNEEYQFFRKSNKNENNLQIILEQCSQQLQILNSYNNYQITTVLRIVLYGNLLSYDDEFSSDLIKSINLFINLKTLSLQMKNVNDSIFQFEIVKKNCFQSCIKLNSFEIYIQYHPHDQHNMDYNEIKEYDKKYYWQVKNRFVKNNKKLVNFKCIVNSDYEQ